MAGGVRRVRKREEEEGKKKKKKKQLGKIQQITPALFLFFFQRQYGGPVGWAPVMSMWGYWDFFSGGRGDFEARAVLLMHGPCCTRAVFSFCVNNFVPGQRAHLPHHSWDAPHPGLHTGDGGRIPSFVGGERDFGARVQHGQMFPVKRKKKKKEKKNFSFEQKKNGFPSSLPLLLLHLYSHLSCHLSCSSGQSDAHSYCDSCAWSFILQSANRGCLFQLGGWFNWAHHFKLCSKSCKTWVNFLFYFNFFIFYFKFLIPFSFFFMKHLSHCTSAVDLRHWRSILQWQELWWRRSIENWRKSRLVQDKFQLSSHQHHTRKQLLL